jgi:hypothetical protein
MPPETKGDSGGPPVAFLVTGVLALGLAGLVYSLYSDAEHALRDLERSKGDYREMVKMEGPIVDWIRRRSKLPSAKDSSEDILQFLDKKRAQAQIPQSLFNTQRNAENKFGGWKENSYTITLRGTKESPVQRPWVVDFLGQVETDRPAVKSKSLALAFAGDNFSSVSVTFSTFVRE